VIGWTVDSFGWLVMLYLPEERAFYGGTLEGALAACHSWLLMSYRETRLAWD
jgi:hypothetical protein